MVSGAEEPQNASPGAQPWPADCGSLLEGCLESFPTWQRGVWFPRALRVLLLRGAHKALATPTSLSDRGTESRECPARRQIALPRPELSSTQPRRHRPPRAPALRPQLKAAPSGRGGRGGNHAAGGQGAGPGEDALAASSPDSSGSRCPRTALSGRAPPKLGARRGLGPAAVRRGGGRRAEPAADDDPAACGRCPRVRAARALSQSGPCGLRPAGAYLGRSWTRRG